MNEETFKVRAYGFGELAQLYCPNVTKKSASFQLRSWIINSKKLSAILKEKGFKHGQKLLTPAQVEIIIIELGEP